MDHAPPGWTRRCVGSGIGNRLPARSPWARWTRRIVGLLATVAFLGVAVAIFQMVRPESGAAVNASEATATPTAEKSSKKKSSKKKSTKPKPLTGVAEARAREGRRRGPRAGRHDVARRGLRPARPAARADRPSGRRRHRRLHRPTSSPRTASSARTRSTARPRSRSPSRARRRSRSATASTRTATRRASPSGTKRVRFRLDGGSMTALDTVPAAEDRFQRTRN